MYYIYIYMASLAKNDKTENSGFYNFRIERYKIKI